MRTVNGFLMGLLVASAAGCGGPSGVKVEGQVVKDGAPVSPGTGETVSIKLSDGKDSYSANAGEGGKFVFMKPSGEPIPAGKYKVSWTHTRSADPYTKKPPFKHAKENAEEWDVSDSNHTFTLDIGKK